MVQASTSVAPLFLAHGAPTLAIDDIPARRFLKTLAKDLAQPSGIVILSPHWETASLKVSAPGPLKTIHDFRGFPQALYDISYDATASTDLVGQVMALLGGAGLDADEDDTWGLDHGAWVPLSLVYPAPDVPVVALSLPYGSTPASVHALGAALAPLKQSGVLLIGSGSTTHNLREIQPEGTPAAQWARDFDAWLDTGLEAGDIDGFTDLTNAPAFRQAHPTEEHLLPVFFAMGAGGPASKPELLHRSYAHGTLSMSYFRF